MPSKILICSDTLSRAPLKEETPKISDTNCQVHLVIPSFLISTERLKQLEVETLNDKTLQRVASYIAQRWPKLQNQLNPELILEMSIS